uniref:gp16 family protein n=1 Tax=Thaumasiovibrio occultus TaxID=1891184 RepID=UPI000B362527|nr:regulatory protein GemA [Thaumasiovibrio occultus]
MNKRNHLIQLIHVGKRELQLDDATYRALLQRETHKQSCKAMSIKELDAVLAAMERQGFKRKQRTAKRYSPKGGKARHPEIDKIRAIWIEMHRHSIVKDGSENALDAYVRRMTNRSKGQGVDAVAWLEREQAVTILESLKAWHRRIAIAEMKERGWTIPTNADGYAGYEAVLDSYHYMQSIP